MSRTIDERILSMQFDNKQFESGIQTSLSTLEKLKQSLNFTGASKGLENVNAAAKGVNFSPLSSAVDAIGTKFSAMQVMAVTALANITNSAVNAGKRIASSLTIEPVKSGFQEYETQINSVQTILANTKSKGSTLDDVNLALDELNAYADKTIYNFTEMTRNIGTFTAAGVDLDKSVSSIKGIANLAAVSGSTSQQASTAMYQLSQALAAGKVQLMDWNSVVNAGMGGQVFQDALKRTAKQMGTNVDALIEKYGSFRESLTKGEWLTADVLTETLTQLSGAYTEADLLAKGYTKEQAAEILDLADTAVNAATKVKTFTQLVDTVKEAAQSGWTQTWEIIVGDFEEAKALWTSVSDVIGGFLGKSAERRNTMLEGAMISNWDKLVKKINEAGIQTDTFEKKLKETAKAHDIDVDSLVKKHGSLEEAFRSGAISSDILKEAVDGLGGSLVDLSNIEKNLKMGSVGEDVSKVQEVLKGMGYDLGKWGVDGKFGAATEAAVKAFQETQGLEVTGIIDEKTIDALEKASGAAGKLKGSVNGLIDGITELGGRELVIEGLKNIFEGLMTVVKPIKRAFEEVFPPITSQQLYKLLEGFKNLTERFKLTAPQVRKVYSAFKGVFSIIDIGLTFVKELAKGVWGLLGNFSGLGDGILGIAGSIGDYFTGLRKSVNETGIFGAVIGRITGFIQSAIDRVVEFASAIRKGFKAPELEGVYSLFKGLWELLKTIGGAIGNVFSSLISGLGEAFKGGGVDGFFSILNGGLFASILLGIRKFIKGDLADLLDIPSDMFDSVKDALESVKGALQSWQQDLQANTLLKIAGAIGILAVAVLILASINPERLGSALAGITALFVDVVGALAIINKMGGVNKGVTKAMVAMVGMSVAVLILASALKKLSSLSWEELAVGIVGVAALTGTIMAASMILGKAKKTVIKGATSMVIFAAALKILASVCKDFASMSWGDMIRGLTGLTVALLAITIAMNHMPKKSFSMSVKNSFGESSQLISSGLAMIAMAASLKILASACKDFASLSWEELARGLVAVGVLLAELSFAMKAMGNANKMISTGLALLVVASSMKILASAVQDFSGMSWDEIGRGLIGMAGALTIMVVALKSLPKKSFGMGAKSLFGESSQMLSSAVAMIGMAAAMKILASVMKDFASLSWGEIGKGLAALGGSILILAVGLNTMNGTLGGSAALLIAAGALAILAPTIEKLGSMSWGEIGKGLLVLAGAFAVLGVAGLLLGPLVPVIFSLAGAFALIGISALALGIGLTAISVAFAALAGASAAQAASFVATLGIIIKGIIGFIPSIAKAIGEGIVMICVAIGESAGAIAEAVVAIVLSLIDVLVECIPQLAEGAFKIITGLLDALADYAPGIIESLFQFIIGVLDGVSANLPELITAGLEVFSAFVTGIIDGLGGVFESLGNALGSVIGGIVEGLLQGISESLPEIGTNLSTFMTNLGPFIEGVQGLDESTLLGMQTMVSMITMLTAAGLLESISSWISGESSLTQFAQDIVPFGEAMVQFSSIVAGNIDESAVAAAANAGKMMAEMATTLPNSGGVVAFFAGDNDMATFASTLVPFGTAIKAFSNEVVGIDETAVAAAANAGKMMAEMAATIPNTGGLISWFTGDNNMVTFGEQLVPFGTAIKAFSNEVVGIDETAVTAAANAGKMMAEMAATIPNTGGLVSWFSGDNDMTTFGGQLISFGTAIKAFSSEVTGIDEGAVTAAANAGKTMAEVADALPESGGVWSWFSADNDMSTFGSQLKSFGGAIKDFSDEVSDIDQSAITSAADAASTLTETANNIPTAEKISALSSFGKHAKKFGAYVNEFHAEISGVDTVKLFGVINSMKKLVAMATDISGINFDGLGSFGASLTKIGKDSIDGFIKAFADAEEKVKKVGSEMLLRLIKGVTSKIPEVNKNCKKVVADAITAIRDKYDSFKSAGKYLVEGLAEGISANTYKAKAKAKAMAEAAVEAARAALKVNSPAKTMIPLGEAIPEGLVLGISNLAGSVKSSAVNMARSAIDGARTAMARITDVINSDVDAQPTIRPVLDLSDVRTGAGAISGMLNMSPTVGVMSNIGAISSMMNSRQNGGNDDVISAIRDLGKTLGGMRGDTYSINGITYDDGSNISDAVKSLVRAARVERRV